MSEDPRLDDGPNPPDIEDVNLERRRIMANRWLSRVLGMISSEDLVADLAHVAVSY